MQTIKKIYKSGYGPSSSHTIGPGAAASRFRDEHPEASGFRVTLYGSLAATGKGHCTDRAVEKALAPRSAEIIWQPEVFLPRHPNGMRFESMDADGRIIADWLVYSTGGGEINDFTHPETQPAVYPHKSMNEILDWCHETGKSLWEYAFEYESDTLFAYLSDVWETMNESISRGLDNEGILPGGLKLARKASAYHVKSRSFSGSLKTKTLVFSYALAVSEENAAGGWVVTAPTCGSCGVMPAVLKYMKDRFDFSDRKITRALATGGLIGNLVKRNASISGAEVGCQGEIGTACAMAAAAMTQLLGGSPAQIEYAAEIGLEHHLGLTCDPIAGLVQIPCIERNAFASARAMNAATFALLSDGQHLVSFDKIVRTMKQTGQDLPSIYRETSAGGLAAAADDAEGE